MSLTRARVSLFAVFVVGFVAQAAAIALVYLKKAIAEGDVVSLMTQALVVYSVPFAVMLGGLFACPNNTGKESPKSRPAFRVALALAIIWNGLLLWRFLAFAYAGFNPGVEDGADKVATYVEQVAKGSSFLIAGALAYFFSRTP